MLKKELSDEQFGEVAHLLTKNTVYNTAYLTAKYLVKELNDDLSAKVLVMGLPGLVDELDSAGLWNSELIQGGSEDNDRGMSDQ